jgi:hypothetical protein
LPGDCRFQCGHDVDHRTAHPLLAVLVSRKTSTFRGTFT